MLKRHSLKTRLVLLIGAVALFSTLGLSQIAAHFGRQQIERDQSTLLNEMANRMVSRLSQDMSTRADEILLLTTLNPIRAPEVPLANKRRLFEQVKRAYPHYAWIGLTDGQGNILTGTDGLLVGKNVAKRAWFIEGSQGLHFGDAHDAFLLAKIMPKPRWDDLPLRLVDVSAPVRDDDGRLLGVICGHLSLDWGFEARRRMLDKLPGQAVDLVVLNHDGRVLMGTPELPSLAVDLSGLRGFQVISSAAAAPAVERWPDGRNYLTAVVAESPFRQYPGMGWSVVARKAEDAAFRRADALVHTITALGIATAVLFGLATWWMLDRQLQPLEQVSRAAEQVRGKDLTVPIPQPQGRDEIAVFARSLSQLVGDLQAYNAQLRLTSRVFTESSQGIMITDPEQRILRVNRAFGKITGYSEDEAIGQTPSILKSDLHDAAFYREMWHCIEQRGFWRGEIWNRNKQGKLYPEWLNINALTDEFGNVVHYIGLFDDITEKKEYEHRLVHLANYDLLTELPNRHLMQKHLQEALARVHGTESGLALLFIDLDKFKHINDTLGHPAGDLVLKEVATRFSAEIDGNQILSRWGGDEFVLVVPGADSMAASSLAKRLIERLQIPFALEGGRYHLSLSVGIALFPVDARSADGLMRCADTAMYRAKKAGANRYQFYEKTMNAGVERFLRIDSALRQALKNKGQGLSLVFQPQFDADGANIVGLEALLRWEHPELGHTTYLPSYASPEDRPGRVAVMERRQDKAVCMVSPAEFIPVAEDTGQILPLGAWVLEQVVKAYAELAADGCRRVPISVNCSVAQLRHHQLVDTLAGLVEKWQVPPHDLTVEVTETAIMSDETQVLQVLERLKAMGFRISIDDFGTGYSCLSYVQKLRPDELKIDRSFVEAIHDNPDSRNIVSFTLGLARTMNVEVVAEGVETIEQLAVLRELGDVTVQGFLFSRPVELGQLKNLLA